jgi:hypothetical protein
MRSTAYQTPEYLEEAIYRSRTYFSSSSYKEYHSPVGFGPEHTAQHRFLYFGSIEGVEESSGNSPLSHSAMLESSRTRDKISALLSGIRNIDDTTKIDEAVEKARSIHLSDPDVTSRFSFGNLLSEAFDRTKKIEYLNESISVRRQEIEYPLLPSMRFSYFPLLSTCLVRRFAFFPNYCTQDLDEALELLSQFVSNARTSMPDRFRRACTWAFLARHYRHSSVSTAYKTALSLMQDTPLFSPTLQLQHTALATHDNAQRLPLDYASYQLNHHQLEEAIETLERGRALLWSEMRHLRTSIDHLIEADPDLGHKFATVNRDLEELTKSIPPSHQLSMDDGAADGIRAVDPFGRLVLKQRDLLRQRDKLISQIQALPGFDSFLRSLSMRHNPLCRLVWSCHYHKPLQMAL